MKFHLPIAKGLGLALVLSVFALPDQVAVAQDVGDELGNSAEVCAFGEPDFCHPKPKFFTPGPAQCQREQKIQT